MSVYDFHPEAERDLDEIWEYIAAANVLPPIACSKTSGKAWPMLCAFRIKATGAPI
jgi:plasmid stabilization system protein ParE